MDVFWAYIVMFALIGSVGFTLAGIVCGIVQDQWIAKAEEIQDIRHNEHYNWLQRQKRNWFVIATVCILIVIGNGYIREMNIEGTITFQGE